MKLQTKARIFEGATLFAAILSTLAFVLLFLGLLVSLGCASTPEVRVTEASCEVTHTDEVAATVACTVEAWIDAQRVELSIDTSLEDELEDRCVSLSFELGAFSFGGLIPSPISAETCEGAPFGLGAAQSPEASTGQQ